MPDDEAIRKHAVATAPEVFTQVARAFAFLTAHSPPHAAGLSPPRCGGRGVACARAARSVVGGHRCQRQRVSGARHGRQHAVGRAGRACTADPLWLVWLVSAPPRTPSAAGRAHPWGFRPCAVSKTPTATVSPARTSKRSTTCATP